MRRDVTEVEGREGRPYEGRKRVRVRVERERKKITSRNRKAKCGKKGIGKTKINTET